MQCATALCDDSRKEKETIKKMNQVVCNNKKNKARGGHRLHIFKKQIKAKHFTYH